MVRARPRLRVTCAQLQDDKRSAGASPHLGYRWGTEVWDVDLPRAAEGPSPGLHVAAEGAPFLRPALESGSGLVQLPVRPCTDRRTRRGVDPALHVRRRGAPADDRDPSGRLHYRGSSGPYQALVLPLLAFTATGIRPRTVVRGSSRPRACAPGVRRAHDAVSVLLVHRGHYIEQLLELEKAYGPDQLHVVLLEDLISDQRSCLESLFGFPGISTDPARTMQAQRKNRYRVSVPESKTKKPAEYPPIAPKTRTRLVEHSDWTTTDCQPGSGVISPSGTSPEPGLAFTTLRLSARESARRAGRPAPR